jgi:hypothetical protein
MALTTHNRKFLAVAAVLAALATGLNLSESKAGAPDGPVALTVAGKIAQSNRPSFEATKDVFFNYLQRHFTQAFEFDMNMLEALGMREAIVGYPGLAQPIKKSSET